MRKLVGRPSRKFVMVSLPKSRPKENAPRLLSLCRSLVWRRETRKPTASEWLPGAWGSPAGEGEGVLQPGGGGGGDEKAGGERVAAADLGQLGGVVEAVLDPAAGVAGARPQAGEIVPKRN